MPLLLCPNCNTNMQAINRSGVEFDMCPTCRGVWLDRGELEKIIQDVRDQSGGSVPAYAPQPQQPPQQTYSQQPRGGHDPRQYGERGEHGERGEYGERGGHGTQGGYRKKRGFDLFDIFD